MVQWQQHPTISCTCRTIHRYNGTVTPSPYHQLYHSPSWYSDTITIPYPSPQAIPPADHCTGAVWRRWPASEAHLPYKPWCYRFPASTSKTYGLMCCFAAKIIQTLEGLQWRCSWYRIRSLAGFLRIIERSSSLFSLRENYQNATHRVIKIVLYVWLNWMYFCLIAIWFSSIWR